MTRLALIPLPLCLYAIWYTPHGVMDAPWQIGNLVAGDRRAILNSSSALTAYIFWWLTSLIPADPFAVIFTVNALATGVCAWLIAEILVGLDVMPLAAFNGGLVFIGSYGAWYLTYGEYQHLALVVNLALFAVLTRWYPVGWGVVLLGAVNGLAVLLRQESFLFALCALTLFGIGCTVRQALGDAARYAIGATAIVLGGVFALGMQGWYFSAGTGGPQEYQAYTGYMPFDPIRALKAQALVLWAGTQILVDAVKDPSLLDRWDMAILTGMTLAGFGMAGWLLLKVRHAWDDGLRAPILACVMWILAYLLPLHAWFWPSHPKYKLATLPPWILLMMMGCRRRE